MLRLSHCWSHAFTDSLQAPANLRCGIRASDASKILLHGARLLCLSTEGKLFAGGFWKLHVENIIAIGNLWPTANLVESEYRGL